MSSYANFLHKLHGGQRVGIIINNFEKGLVNQRASCGNKLHKGCSCWCQPPDSWFEPSLEETLTRDLAAWLSVAHDVTDVEHKRLSQVVRRKYGHEIKG